MNSLFDIENFKVSLAETIAYCSPRFNEGDLTHCFRTTLPERVNAVVDYDLVPRLVEAVRIIRAVVLNAENLIHKAWKRPIPPLPQGLQNGRLLILHMNQAVHDPAAGAETLGFFDNRTIPACDTWVWYDEECLPSYPDTPNHSLICWIPESLIPFIHDAISSDPTECIEWLDKTTEAFSFLPALRDAHLI